MHTLRLTTFEGGAEIGRQVALPGDAPSLNVSPGRRIVIEELQLARDIADGRRAITAEAENLLREGFDEWIASEAPQPDPEEIAERERQLAELQRQMNETFAGYPNE